MFLILVVAVLVVLFVVEAVLTEVEHWGWATVVMLLTLVGLHFTHVFSLYEFFRDHALEGLIGTAGYVGAGLVWSFIKWLSFLMGFRDTYREQREAFLGAKNLPTDTKVLTEEQEREFLEGLSYMAHTEAPYVYDADGKKVGAPRRWKASLYDYRGNSLNVRPRAAKNKSRITSWAIFWPFSLVGTLINDPLRRLWNLIWGAVKGLYQKMSDRMFASHPELK